MSMILARPDPDSTSHRPSRNYGAQARSPELVPADWNVPSAGPDGDADDNRKLNRHFRIATVCVVLAGLMAAATVSLAAPANETYVDTATRHVRYGDLDLATQEGVTALYQRIRSAAWAVCIDHDSAAQPAQLQARWVQCRASAIDNAVGTVGTPALTEYHRRAQGTHGEGS